MAVFNVHVSLLADARVAPAADLPHGLLRPAVPAPVDAPGVFVHPGRDAARDLALRFLAQFRAQKPGRGSKPNEAVEFVFAGPPPLGGSDSWTEQRICDWGAACEAALLGLFPAGDAGPLVLEAATHFRPGIPLTLVRLVPRVEPRGGKLRMSWHQLQGGAAERIVGVSVVGGAQQLSRLRIKLYELVGPGFGLDRVEPRGGGRAMIYTTAEEVASLKRDRQAALDAHAVSELALAVERKGRAADRGAHSREIKAKDEAAAKAAADSEAAVAAVRNQIKEEVRAGVEAGTAALLQRAEAAEAARLKADSMIAFAWAWLEGINGMREYVRQNEAKIASFPAYFDSAFLREFSRARKEFPAAAADWEKLVKSKPGG